METCVNISLLAPTFWSGHGLTINILTEGEKFFLATSQFRKCEMAWIWLRLQCHMPSVAVELPDQTRITGECLWCSQTLCLVAPP